MGQILRLGRDLEEIDLLPEHNLKDRIYLSVEALPADVCDHRYLDRQRATQEVKVLGEVDGTAVQKALPNQANAGVAGTEVGDWVASAYAYGLRWREWCRDAGTIYGDSR